MMKQWTGLNPELSHESNFFCVKNLSLFLQAKKGFHTNKV